MYECMKNVVQMILEVSDSRSRNMIVLGGGEDVRKLIGRRQARLKLGTVRSQVA